MSLDDLVRRAMSGAPTRPPQVPGPGSRPAQPALPSRAGEAGAVGYPRLALIAEAVELPQRLLGVRVLAVHQLRSSRTADGATEAAADESQPSSGSPQAGQGGLSGPAPASSGTTWVGCASLKTQVAYDVCAAQRDHDCRRRHGDAGDERADVAMLMRDNRVGSIVIVDSAGSPLAMVTIATWPFEVFAEGLSAESPVIDCASQVSGEPEMELGPGGRADGPAPGPAVGGGRRRAAGGDRHPRRHRRPQWEPSTGAGCCPSSTSTTG